MYYKTFFLLALLLVLTATLTAQPGQATPDKIRYELAQEIPFPELLRNSFGKSERPYLQKIVFSPPTYESAGRFLYAVIDAATGNNGRVLFTLNESGREFDVEAYTKINFENNLTALNYIRKEDANRTVSNKEQYFYIYENGMFKKKELKLGSTDSTSSRVPDLIFSDGRALINYDRYYNTEFGIAKLLDIETGAELNRISPGLDLEKLRNAAQTKFKGKYGDLLPDINDRYDSYNYYPHFTTMSNFYIDRIFFFISDYIDGFKQYVGSSQFSTGYGYVIFDENFNKLGEIEIPTRPARTSISPSGRYIALNYVTDKYYQYLYDDRGNLIMDFGLSGDPFSELKWSADDNLIIYYAHGNSFFYNLKTKKRFGFSYPGIIKAFSSEETGLAVAYDDGKLKIVDFKTGEQISTINDIKPISVYISGNGNEILCYNRRSIYLYRRVE